MRMGAVHAALSIQRNKMQEDVGHGVSAQSKRGSGAGFWTHGLVLRWGRWQGQLEHLSYR
jgi:hypothetical protein